VLLALHHIAPSVMQQGGVLARARAAVHHASDSASESAKSVQDTAQDAANAASAAADSVKDSADSVAARMKKSAYNVANDPTSALGSTGGYTMTGATHSTPCWHAKTFSTLSKPSRQELRAAGINHGLVDVVLVAELQAVALLR